MYALIDYGLRQEIEGVAREALLRVGNAHIAEFWEYLHDAPVRVFKFFFRIIRARTGTTAEDNPGAVWRWAIVVIGIAGFA